MTHPSIVQPHLSVLTPEQIAEVHERSTRLLSAVGVRVDSPHALQLFARATGQSAGDDRRVRIPPELVEWALRAAPSGVDVYDRLGNPAFRLGGAPRFGVGVTCLYYQDPDTDRVVPFARHHMRAMVRLGSALPSFDVISTVGVVQDVDPAMSDMVAALEMAANTDKPLVLLVSDERRFPAVLDLLEAMNGDLAARPSVLPYVNPLTPLVLNQGTVDKAIRTIERGLPLIWSSYGMAGATTPIAPTGTLVLLQAELLAGLVLSQLVCEGASIVLGFLPSFFDMRTMSSFYDPLSYLLNLACAEMMAWYGLPHCGTSGSGMGWGPDLLTAANQWANHLTSCLGKVGLVPFVGDVLGSKAFSPACLVYADEVIAQARRLAQGFALDDAASTLDETARVGPGGDFLTSEQTLARFRTAYYRSAFLDNLTLEQWQAQGCPQAVDRLRQHTRQRLSDLPAPADWTERTARGEAFLRTVSL